MSNIEKIKAEIEGLKGEVERGNYYLDSADMACGYEAALDDLLAFIDSLPEETSYDINKLTPTPSVNIEDVARVQFASHAHVFDRKRKAVFDWEQFKEVVGIFYGFGKRDSLPEEKPSEDLEEAASRGGFDYVDEIEAKAPGLPWNDHDVEFGYRDGFIAGAEWQKEQMMKEVKYGVVCKNGERDEEDVWIELNPGSLPDYKDTDPIDFIIVKQ